MAYQKPTKGQPRSANPLHANAAFFGDLVDVVNVHKSGVTPPRRAHGRGIDSNLVDVNKLTGDDLPRGSVIQLGENEIDEIGDYPDQPMFAGNVVDAELGVDRNIAVLIDATPDGEFGRAQVSGRCLAKVSVTDILHTHAYAEDGETVLRSDFAGPVQILSAVESTGEQELWVQLGVAPPNLVGKANSTIAALSGSTPGSGAVTLWEWDGNNLTATSKVAQAVKNLSQGTVTAGVFIQIKYHGGRKLVDFESCGGGDE